MPPRFESLLQRSFLAVLGLAAAACASFSAGRLPKHTLSEFEGDRRLAAVTYQTSDWVLQPADATLMAAQPASPTVVDARVEPLFRRAFVEATRQREPGPWHVDIYYRETLRNPAISYTLMLFFIGSLGIIPSYAVEDLYLEAKLKHDGATVQQYIYEERISTWVHWLLLPWTFTRDPLERKSELIDNMILNLLHDLARDLPPVEPSGPQQP